MSEEIDLHAHTTHSDGTSTPEELVKLAGNRGLSAVAITDHDVISGVKPAMKASRGKDLDVVPGIEFTARVDCSENSIHLLGYLFDVDDSEMVGFSNQVQEKERSEAEHKIEATNDYFGSDISYEDVAQRTDGVPGSPHIVEELLSRGLVDNFEAGIYKFVDGGPLDIDIDAEPIHAKKAIEMIHAGGGVSVLAHLFAYKEVGKYVKSEEQKALVKELSGYGLDGLEVIIPGLNDDEREFGERLCDEFQLIMTGGSDFHDETRLPQNALGSLSLPVEMLEDLRDRASRYH